MITKEQADYSKGEPQAHCSICAHFRPPHSCALVEGEIEPDGWCKLFERRESRSDDAAPATELDVARGIAAGVLPSPQRFGNLWLFAIRITGTGLAYRLGRDEFCWRDPSIYLNDEFLARCNGLPVILDHPPTKPALDSKEFKKRSIGTTFLPFIRGDEVWAVVKIYDAQAIDLMLNEQVSTSPAVVFNETSGNETVALEDGRTLLIEGKPALLDHIAVCSNGVWDKGRAPTGVQNDSLSQQEPIGMTEEEKAAADKARKDADDKLAHIADALSRMHARMDAMEEADQARKDAEDEAERKREEDERKDRARRDAARKDKFGPRKDGETVKEYRERHDADMAAMMDELVKGGVEKDRARKDAEEARRDAEERERKDGGEAFEEWAKEEEQEPEHKKDARKDREDEPDEEHEDRMDRARHDAQTIRDLTSRLKAAEDALRVITTGVSPEERDRLANAQARADSIAGLFGRRATAPIPGESSIEYRRRLANDFKQHSPRFKAKSLAGYDADVLEMAEEQIYADAAAAAKSPERAAAGVLIPIVETDVAGRRITKWTGDNMAWMQHFMTGAQIGRINRPQNRI